MNQPDQKPLFKISIPASAIEDVSCPTCQTQFYPETFPPWANRYCSERCQKVERRLKDPIGYLKACHVPERYLNCSFENFDTNDNNRSVFKTLSEVKNITDTIYLSGTVGTGKTHLSVALARNIRTSQIEKANFQPATSVLLQLRAGFGKDSNISERDSLKCYQKNEVLIIDDLGAEKLTDYVIQAWYSIIDYRYSNMLPTVITSNLSVADLAVRFGDRIASRIASGNVLTLRGSDRRLEQWRR